MLIPNHTILLHSLPNMGPYRKFLLAACQSVSPSVLLRPEQLSYHFECNESGERVVARTPGCEMAVFSDGEKGPGWGVRRWRGQVSARMYLE